MYKVSSCLSVMDIVDLQNWPVIKLPYVFVPCELTFLSKLENIINSLVVLKK